LSYATTIPDDPKDAAGVHSWSADLISAEELCSAKNEERFKKSPIMIEGLLAQGDLALITAGSKSFKSWLALQIAICTANGIPLLDRPTLATKTLFLNFELKPSSIKSRLLSIAHQLKCGVTNLHIWNLRNKCVTEDFLVELSATIREQGFGLVIIDPLYAFYGVSADPQVENSNPAITALLSMIRSACEEVGAAVIVVHHHAKGDASGKASIDRSSGAGALGRFPDFVMSLISHESPCAYIVEIDFRDFPPCGAFVIRRDRNIMILDEDLDPASKKTKPTANQKGSARDVPAFLTEKAIRKPDLISLIASAKTVVRKTAERWIDDAIKLKLCSSNRHGIYRAKDAVQTTF